MIVKIKKKEILENIEHLKSENRRLKSNNTSIIYFLIVAIGMLLNSYLNKSFESSFILLIFSLAPIIVIAANRRMLEKNKLAIETLNKIIGVEIKDKQIGENDENTNN